MKNVIELDETNFEPEVFRAAGPVLVDFYAPWCGPCRMLAPCLEPLANELAGRVKVAKLNVDEVPQQAEHYEITGVPTLMLFHHGKVQGRTVGLPSLHALKATLENVTREPASIRARDGRSGQ